MKKEKSNSGIEKIEKEKWTVRIKEKRKAKKEAFMALEPEVRKKKKRKRIILTVAIVIVLLIGSQVVFAGNSAMPVTVKAVSHADVESTLSTSGTVKSEKIKTYFSDVDSQIGNIPVTLGEEVKKGKPVIFYDEKDIDLALQNAQLEVEATQKGYEAVMADNARIQSQLSAANSGIAQADPLIDQQEALVKQLEDSISDEVAKKRADLYDRQYQLQISLNNHKQQLETSEPGSDEFNNTQGNMYKIQADLEKVSNDLARLQDYKTGDNREDILVKAKKDLADMQAIYEEARADRSGSKNAVMTKAKIDETKASSDKNLLTAQDRLDRLTVAKEGIKAEFDGIVTSVDVVEGTPVSSAGTKLFTLESSKDVKVEISVSKYDLEQLAVDQSAQVIVAGKTYEAKVSKINRMATPNSSGTPVVSTEVKIENPDESVYLGVEAKVIINTAKAENVITAPIEAVNADKEGDFCYVVEDGIVVRKNVVIGISSDQLVEIKEGLAEGDQVIVASPVAVEEGMKVSGILAE